MKLRVVDRMGNVLKDETYGSSYLLNPLGVVVEVVYREHGGDRFVVRDDLEAHLSIGINDVNGVCLFEKDVINFFGEIITIEDIFQAGYMIGECTLIEGDFEIIGFSNNIRGRVLNDRPTA